LREWAAPHLRAELEDFGTRRAARISDSRASDALCDIPIPAGQALLGYQRAGVAFALRRDHTLIADEMGLGKTIQAIAVINATEPERVLIVCPAIAQRTWETELERWLTRPYRVARFPDDGDIVICTYGRAEKVDRHWPMVILDEAHYIKNPKAARSAAIVGTREITGITGGRQLALTGTPIPNRPIELYPILKWLGAPVAESWYSYVTRFCGAYKHTWGWDVSGSANLTQLAEELRSTVMVRRKKADVLTELPEKRRRVICIDGKAGLVAEERALDDQHRAILGHLDYDTAATTLHNDAAKVFGELTRVRQALGIAKLPAVTEHLEAIDQPVVVFGYHRAVVTAIAEHLGVPPITGETPTAERERIVADFEAGGRAFVGSIGAAGVALTLTRASHVVFAELDWVPGNIIQAEDRCHRIGQRNAVLCDHIVFDGSLDADMVFTLAEKAHVIGDALGD